MTASTESSVASNRGDGPLAASWRETTLRKQEVALPPGEVTVTCSAPFGAGGLGRHLSEIAGALRRAGRPCECISGSSRGAPSASALRGWAPAGERPRLSGALARVPLPISPGLRTRGFMTDFDAYAAARLPACEQLVAFNGQALAQFRAAQGAGCRSLTLASANSHIRQVARRHAEARRRFPLEGSWTTHLVERNLAEYARADRIYVASQYVRESFLQEGFAPERLVDFPLTPDPRYSFEQPPAGDRFDIVYVGSLTVHKGVPLLIDAVRRLVHADIRLTLVGGWGTRGMRRFVQAACAADPRIVVSPGDPLARLRAARLCVHPAYEDGFAYAPAEALACGVPVLVSEDTGMKELIEAPRTGLVLPTGDLDALTEAIEAAYRGDAFATSRAPGRTAGDG